MTSEAAQRIAAAPQEMQLPNGMTVVQVSPDETTALYREIFSERRYLRHGISLDPGDVVVDVGANIGMTTLFFHTECAGLRFYACEPAPIPYAALTANVAAHGVAATTIQCALSDYSGVGLLTYYPNTTVMSGFHADPAAEEALTRSFLERSGLGEKDIDGLLHGKYETTTVECPVKTLSEIVAEQAIGSIDLLKIDVEKSELAVLRGLRETDWPKVRQIVAEVHDSDGALEAVRGLLVEHGFSVIQEQDAMLAGTEIHEVFATRP
jgi:31-O-methyltransferase